MRVTCHVNGEQRFADDVWPGESLLHVLRERMGLPGSKNACEQGECGSCSVLLDGDLVCACLVLSAQADGHEVTTVEGLAAGGELHNVAALTGGMVAQEVVEADPELTKHPGLAGLVAGLLDEERAEYLEKA